LTESGVSARRKSELCQAQAIPTHGVGVAFFLGEEAMRLLMIDNYDSFTYNLVQLFGEFDVEVEVFRHDRITLEEIAARQPNWLCISPGPKDPAHAGISKAVIRRFAASVPTLGVCLGMQAINEVFGGVTCKAPEPRHGKRSQVHHGGRGIFAGVPSPFEVARYHSLQVIIQSPLLMALAHAEDGVVMGLQHRAWPLCGVQFHPESFMTAYGVELVANFLRLQPCWHIPPTLRLREDRFPRMTRPVPEDSRLGMV
jgi:anthranilate synthase component II